MECPPLVVTPPDYRSGSGAVEGGQVTYPRRRIGSLSAIPVRGRQPLGSDVELLGLLWEPLPCLQNRGRHEELDAVLGLS